MSDMMLIDANVLTRWLESVLSNANPLDRKARAAFSEVLARVKTMPDIDAVPVVRAQWVWADDGYCRCTNCLQKAPVILQFQDEPETTMTKYCPHCGALMRGGGDFI